MMLGKLLQGAHHSFILNHGDHLRSPADIFCRLLTTKAFGERVNKAIARARDCLSAARSRMKDSADVKRKDMDTGGH